MSKVVLITGGTSGIGLGVVKELRKGNYKIYSVSRDIDKILLMQKEYPDVNFIQCDLSSKINIENMISDLRSKENKIDILINSAGIIHAGGVQDLSAYDFDEMFSINVTAIFTLCKYALPLLKKSDAASIVNVSSISSKMTGSSIAYSACKAAVDMMTKSMAKEFADYGIRVNSVNPGVVDTGFQVHNGLCTDDGYPKLLDNINETYPLGLGHAEDVVELINYLISDKARWMTGSNLIIDGGRSVNI